ncbi:MAG: hypothetical protein WCK74_03805 [Gemmatimonadaceae bacterium]
MATHSVAAQQPASTNTPPADPPHVMVADPLGLSMTRMGSGTSWLPDSAPMYGVMRSAGNWSLMLHGTVFGQYIHATGPRGASQLGSVNTGMVNAMRTVGGGRLQLRAMGSLDAFTVGGRGYPLLLQTGESYRGEAIHDRQHPHDLFMELAAVYERALSPTLGLQLYAAPVGEPALGPVAFPHRASAAADPFATLSHHWQDATHVSFGVVTAGLYSPRVKVEASVFNGREPDDIRTNFDFKGARLDSYAGRITVAASPALMLSTSYGRLAYAEAAHPGEAVHRATASALWSRTQADGGSQSLAFIAGANAVGHSGWTPGFTVEGLTDLHTRWQLFARAEAVQKTAEELVLPAVDHHAMGSSSLSHVDDPEQRFVVGHISAGVLREVALSGAGRVGLGTRITINVVPTTLRDFYGSSTPLGLSVFVRWRTGRMTMTTMDHSMDHSLHRES